MGADNKSTAESASSENEGIVRAEKSRKRYGILTYERLSQFLLTNLFFGAETYYDITKVPERYGFLKTTMGKLPQLDLSPETAQMFDSLGDVLEISVGAGIVRFSLAVVEEIVKSEPIKKIVRSAMQNEALNNLVEKTIGTEKTEELSTSGEIRMSDDAQFWTALVPWTVVKAAHSLGLISLGANDHIGAPVPHMLIGQAFAVASLVAVHYGTKNAEEIAEFTSAIFNKTSEFASGVQVNFTSGIGQIQSRAKQGISRAVDTAVANIDTTFNSITTAMNGWIKKMDELDPNKVIPSPEQLLNTLSDRVGRALAAIGIENEKNELE